HIQLTTKNNEAASLPIPSPTFNKAKINPEKSKMRLIHDRDFFKIQSMIHSLILLHLSVASSLSSSSSSPLFPLICCDRRLDGIFSIKCLIRFDFFALLLL